MYKALPESQKQLEKKVFAWTAGETDAEGKVKKVKRHVSSSDAYIRRQRIAKAQKIDPELIKVLRKDIEREVQGGSVNVKFDQMKRMMGASKLIGVFQKRTHWWRAKAIFRWKYGHVDMLVHQLRRLSKKLDDTVEESDKFQTMLYDVESKLIELTGSRKKWSQIKKTKY